MTARSRIRPLALSLAALLLAALAGCADLFHDAGGDHNGANGDPATALANRAPAVDAGPDQTVFAGESVTLDGTATRDADGDRLIFAWVQTGSGPFVDLRSGASSRPRFTAPEVASPTFLTFALTVSDGVAAATDEVTILVQPRP